MARPRKSGKRTSNGRLSRAKDARYDHGTDRAIERKVQYRGNGYDAIGRAYERGLLGRGEDGKPTEMAKGLLNMARSLSRAYWCEYEVGHEGCTLGQQGATTVHFGPPIRGLDDPAQERWLNAMLARIHWTERKVFDELVLDHFPDHGPAWLDRIIGGCPIARDVKFLATALEALSRMVVDRIPERA